MKACGTAEGAGTRRRGGALRRGWVSAVIGGAAITGMSAPALAEEIPGHDGRITHQTFLSTDERDCHEINIPRATVYAATDGLVPDRYTVAALPTFARVRIIDYVCESLTVDGQPHARQTQVTIGAVQLAQQGTSTPYYILWLGTDNPVLAARYRQLGIPAVNLAGSTSLVTLTPAGGLNVTLQYTTDDPSEPSELDHTITTRAPIAPLPVPTPGSQLRLFHDDERGQTQVVFNNLESAATAGVITADLTRIRPLADIIVFPSLLTIGGTTSFGGSTIRGSWEATVTRSAASESP